MSAKEVIANNATDLVIVGGGINGVVLLAMLLAEVYR